MNKEEKDFAHDEPNDGAGSKSHAQKICEDGDSAVAEHQGDLSDTELESQQ